MVLNYRIKWLISVLTGSVIGSLIAAIASVIIDPILGQSDYRLWVEFTFEIITILSIGTALWSVQRPIDIDRKMLINIGAVLLGINLFLGIIFAIIGNPAGMTQWLVIAGVAGSVSGVISGISFSRLELQYKQQ